MESSLDFESKLSKLAESKQQATNAARERIRNEHPDIADMLNQFKDKFGPLKQITVEIGGEVVFNMDTRYERKPIWNGSLRPCR